MRRVWSVLAIVGICATGAMAIDIPSPDITLDVRPSGGYGTLSLSGSGSSYHGRLTASSSYAYLAAVATPPSGDDYSLRTLVHFENATELGLAARANLKSSSTYEVSINPTNGFVALNKIFMGGSNPLDANWHIPDFNAGNDYGLILTVSGGDPTTVTANVYDSNWHMLHTLNGTDSSGMFTLTTGPFGLFELPQNGQLCDGTFVIPEPAAVASLIAGALAPLGRSVLRRRRG
jgi:hypothetical protein